MSNVSTNNAFETACCPAPVPGAEEFARTETRLAGAELG